jgi:hypothetical protein
MFLICGAGRHAGRAGSCTCHIRLQVHPAAPNLPVELQDFAVRSQRAFAATAADRAALGHCISVRLPR